MLNFKTPDELRVWAFDPGESTGVVLWENSKPAFMLEVQHEDLFTWLEEMKSIAKPGDVVIMEDYKVRPSKSTAHYWSTVPAIQVKGAVNYWCYQNGGEWILQQPAVKPVGFSRMQKSPNKGPLNHAWDAVAHLVYYLHVNNYG